MNAPWLAVASADWVDLCALAGLAMFLLWGGMHGAVKQALGLCVLVGAFAAASAFSTGIEAQVAKVADLEADGRSAVAWLVVWSCVVAGGGIVLGLLGRLLDRMPPGGGTGRAVGGLLGVVKGVLVLSVALYALLGAATGPGAPAVVHSIRESRAGEAAVRLEEVLRSALRLPPGVVARVASVQADIRTAHPR